MATKWSAHEIAAQTLRIMSQGATAMQRLVDAYYEKRTPESDINWLAIQAAREFGATNMYADRARLALESRVNVREADRFAEIMKEELDHYRAYMNLIDLTIGKGTPLPDPDYFQYLAIEYRAQGIRFIPGAEPIVTEKWPEHHRFISQWMHAFNDLPEWTSRMLMIQGEGGSIGWHWCMSKLPADDEFLKYTAKLEKTVVEDELFHGPEEVKGLAQSYDPDQAIPLEEMFTIARELRYLDIRERNEQFLHPLSEVELRTIRDDILSDALEPANLYDKVA